MKKDIARAKTVLRERELGITPDMVRGSSNAKGGLSVAENRNRRKEVIGRVVSDKMEKTIVVGCRNLQKAPAVRQADQIHQKVQSARENNQAKVGDLVRIMETRPLSKEKRWRLVEIVEESVM